MISFANNASLLLFDQMMPRPVMIGLFMLLLHWHFSDWAFLLAQFWLCLVQFNYYTISFIQLLAFQTAISLAQHHKPLYKEWDKALVLDPKSGSCKLFYLRK